MTEAEKALLEAAIEHGGPQWQLRRRVLLERLDPKLTAEAMAAYFTNRRARVAYESALAKLPADLQADMIEDFQLAWESEEK